MTNTESQGVDETQGQLAIVIPAFDDRESCEQLATHLVALLGDRAFLVVVDDGSVSHPIDPAALAATGARGQVLTLRRNVGHQRAIAVGLCHVAENLSHVSRVVVMDSDGEDVPATLPELLEALAPENVDVVVAQRRNRAEQLWFRAFYRIYRVVFKLMTGRAISFGNFMALKQPALRRLVAMQELWIHLASSVLISRLRVAFKPLDRGRRYAGHSKLNFVGLVLHGFRGAMVFAEDVLVRVGIACAVVAMLSVIASVIALGLKIFGYATPGWFSVALGILVLMFLQTGALTLMTLMLTGIVRGVAISGIDYRTFIDRVIPLAPPHSREPE